MKMLHKSLTLVGAMVLSSVSHAVLIDFESLAIGTTVSNQFAGVTFSPNAFSGDSTGWYINGAGIGTWGDDTGMTVGDSYADGGANYYDQFGSNGGTNFLHTIDDWLGEAGDPSILMAFDDVVTSIGMAFLGDSAGDSGFVAFDSGGNFVGYTDVTGYATGDPYLLKTASMSFSVSDDVRYIGIIPGGYNDWVGVDDIRYEVAPVPEPATMSALGLGVLAALRRRKK